MDILLGDGFFDGDSDDDDTSSKAVKTCDDAQVRNASGEKCDRRALTEMLTEIFSVRFLELKKQNIEDVYGLILVQSGYYPYVVFERLFGDPQCIDSKGYIKLIGPRRAIATNLDGLELVSCLFNSRVQETPKCHSACMWTLVHTSFDQLMCKEFISDYGPGEIQYAVYRNGAEAILEVTLIDWEGKGECGTTEVQIFGTIRARNNKVLNCEAQSLLFSRNSEEAISIGYGDVIPLPLARKAVALPLGSILMVDLCIWHSCNSLSMGGILVEDTVPFDSSLVGEEEKVVCGSHGKIKVKATWKTRVHLGGNWGTLVTSHLFHLLSGFCIL